MKKQPIKSTEGSISKAVSRSSGDAKNSIFQEIKALYHESHDQIKKDLMLLFPFIFKNRKKIKPLKQHQVIFGNRVTSTRPYKRLKLFKRIIQKKWISLRIQISILIERLVAFFQLVLVRFIYFSLGAIFIALLIFFYQADHFVKNLPAPTQLTTRDIPTTTKIYDRNGTLLYEIYADENRTPVKLTELPVVIKQATIAIEDKDFYLHQGVSPVGVVRALIHNLNSDSLEGGSTITQQLIRSSFLTPEKTIRRKLLEMALAFWAEKVYTKEQILEMYLNQVPYGGTAWGIESASQLYFGKSAKRLTLSEAALLAGLPAAPSLYSPFGGNKDLAKDRQLHVLDRMVSGGYISEEIAKKAKEEDLDYKNPRISIAAPHFVMYVKDLLDRFYGEKRVATAGLRVYTTLDLSIQNMAEKIVSSQAAQLKSLSVGNAAALVTNPKNGEILAMVGSKDYFDEDSQGYVNVTTSLRQPGSSVKVITYAAALERGFKPESLLDDTPVSYFDGYRSYTPVNYDGKYHGKVALRVALGSSYNIPAVRTLATVGLDTMINLGRKMGITSWKDTSRFGLSLTLGGGEVSMLDMAKVYGTLANDGTRVDLTPFVKITDYKGEVFPLPIVYESETALNKETARLITSILSDNSARSPAFGPTSALFIPQKAVAVKTGTSDNKRDNWTIGYTPDFVTTVWVGNNNNAPMHPSLTSGVTGAAPIWHDIMTQLLNITLPSPTPSK